MNGYELRDYADKQRAFQKDEDEVEVGDVIQIIDEAHPWYPSLLIVDEVKPWGVQAFVIVPDGNSGSFNVSLAYNRLTEGSYKRIGPAEIILP